MGKIVKQYIMERVNNILWKNSKNSEKNCFSCNFWKKI